jgi:hypothetical protein
MVMVVGGFVSGDLPRKIFGVWFLRRMGGGIVADEVIEGFSIYPAQNNPASHRRGNRHAPSPTDTLENLARLFQAAALDAA